MQLHFSVFHSVDIGVKIITWFQQMCPCLLIGKDGLIFRSVKSTLATKDG
jgi:hypothetical protein